MGSDNAKHREVSIDNMTIQKLRRYADGRSLRAAIEQAIRHGVEMMEKELSGPVTGMIAGLSSRQQEVLKLLRLGLSVKEISSELGIGEASVRTHIARLRDRLEMEDLLALRFRA